MCFTKPKNHFCLLKFAENSPLAVIGVSEQKLTMSRARSENTPCERLAWHSAHVINQREDLKGSSAHTTPVKLLMFDFFGGGTKKGRTTFNQKIIIIMLEPPVSAQKIYCMAPLSFLLRVFVLFSVQFH